MEYRYLDTKGKLDFYRKFMNCETFPELKALFLEHWVEPSKDEPFIPSYQYPRSSPILAGLKETHNGLRNFLGRVPEDKIFNALWIAAITCYPRNEFRDQSFDEYTEKEWTQRRYDIPWASSLRPPYRYQAVEPDEIEYDRASEEKDRLEGKDYDSRVMRNPKILYKWLSVRETLEGDIVRYHCILVDKVTGTEAPLKPGVKPYVPDEVNSE